MSKNIWFTSDQHYHHKNVIEYSNRPFKYVEDMNEALISNYNSLVDDGDDVYILGDFCLSNPDNAESIICRLKGRKHLILGNHDHANVVKRLEPHVMWIKDTYLLTVQDHEHVYGKQLLWLSHYPHLSWPQSHYGTIMLHGHWHNTVPSDPNTLRLDVGVDCFGYKPISYKSIKDIMINRIYKSKELSKFKELWKC